MIAYFCTRIGGRLGGETRTLARTTDVPQDGSAVTLEGELYGVSRLRDVETGQARCTMTYRGPAPDEHTDADVPASSGESMPEDTREEPVETAWSSGARDTAATLCSLH